MIKKRIIFTLLYSEGYFYLTRNFSLQKVGDLNWLVKNYDFFKISSFIDELVILNIRKKKENFYNFCEVIKSLSKNIFIPIAAGGGIENIDHANSILRSGADKLVCNTLLRENPHELEKIKNLIGQQSIVGSIDVVLQDNKFKIFDSEYLENKKETLDVFFRNNPDQLVGEFYINSVDKDGTGQGYSKELMVEISKYTNNPIIIAGGAGNWKHLLEGLQSKKINAVATANLLNFIGNGLENARKEILKEFDLPVW
jgi:cyclase